MLRVAPLAPALLAVLVLAAAARAQPAPGPDVALSTAQPETPPPAPSPPAIAPAPVEPVGVTSLAAPDAFTTAARDTGLPPTLWRGTSLQVAEVVLPLLGERPLPGAAGALARRILATGAQGPNGALQKPELIGLRAQALMTQGDPKGAAAILARAPGLDRNAAAARAAAESALLAGDDQRACQVEHALTDGRGDIYWVRLRAYCQAIAGQADQAQLTFDLAQSQAKDAVFGRLMVAKLSGAGNPGAPSLRNGLDYALSRSLGLDLSTAKPSPAVAAALTQGDPADPKWDLSVLAADLAPAANAVAKGPLPAVELERLLDAADVKDPKARARAAAAALIAEPFAEPLGPTLRARMAALPISEGKAPAGRDLALDLAAADKRMGETALLALWTCAETPAAGGLAPADRARIVRALRRAGLAADARAFALEGLLALQ
jgi:hypothetical protein